jgi:hypothetical protein
MCSIRMNAALQQSHIVVFQVLGQHGELFADAIDRCVRDVVGAVRQFREYCLSCDGVAWIVQTGRHLNALHSPLGTTENERDQMIGFEVVLNNQAFPSRGDENLALVGPVGAGPDQAWYIVSPALQFPERIADIPP